MKTAVFLIFSGILYAQKPTIDWKAQEAEILRHYSALVQIDSSNPPGNETLVVNYL